MASVVLPALLFLGGVTYIALDTFRILLVGKGYRVVAGAIGVVEVVVFLLAVSRVLSGPLEPLNVVAYALGFGVGTWLGGFLEERVAVGHVLVRVITQRDATALLEALGKDGYGITHVAAKGQYGRTRIIFSILKRKNVPHFLKLVDAYNPKAFASVEDVRSVRDAREHIDSFMHSV